MTGSEGGAPIRWGREPQDLLATSRDGTHLLLRRCRVVQSFGALRPHLGELPLIARLGRGGMGAVFLAWHPIRCRQVAVKVLPDVQHLDRFRREARIATDLRSPHLVTVYDVERDGTSGLYYLVMEFVPGQSAAHWANEVRVAGGRVPERAALQVMTAVARGMSAAHAAGVIHRDIKPENVLVPATAQGVLDLSAAKVIDLGLALSLATEQRLTAFGVPMGTPGYMAPEQCLNAYHAAATSDVFSLGATLYDLLTGMPPFPKDLSGTLLKTPSGDYVPLPERRPDVSRATAAIVAKCLATEPRERFADAASLLAALESAARDPGAAPRGTAGRDADPRTAGAATSGPATRPTPGADGPLRRTIAVVVLAAVVTAAAATTIHFVNGSGSAGTATLRVVSQTPGAEIFVNDRSVGHTPLDGIEVPSGRRVRISVRDAQGEFWRKSLRPKPGDRLEFDAEKR